MEAVMLGVRVVQLTVGPVTVLGKLPAVPDPDVTTHVCQGETGLVCTVIL
jgi:hypothetical protein